MRFSLLRHPFPLLFLEKQASFLEELGIFSKFVNRNGAAALFYLIEKRCY